MKNYSFPNYYKCRDWIIDARKNGITWEHIEYANCDSEDRLYEFLKIQKMINFWPDLSVDDWKNIVHLQKEAEEKAVEFDEDHGQAIIVDEAEGNNIVAPTDPNSSWQLYKNNLKRKGFKDETLNEMERSTEKILRRLSKDTTSILPIKGLVIGNVQSGKTANMAALMAMAADWGWNMFIILSGTIENLRKQTQTRLFQDLDLQGNLYWRSLEHLSKNTDISQKAQSLHFEEDSKQRYFNVCLKNPSRLKKLIQWLQADKNKQKQMRILVIDDEADQAGINTADITTNEKRTINKLICALVNGNNEKDESIDSKYKAMNYIGYTATPYANVLNDSKPESLYPKNFISTLSVSKEYFGPQQIFGYSGANSNVEYEGLDIVRTIDNSDIDDIKDIHNGYSTQIPRTLEQSIEWFLCGVACMRLWKYKKPITMLIHTSQKTDHHENIAKSLQEWRKRRSSDEIIKRCKILWEEETSIFSLSRFKEEYTDYGCPEINSYPSFENLEGEIRKLLSHNITNIPLDNEYEPTYHEGIHLCIDNYRNNGINDEGMQVRLAYPDSNNMPSTAPAFIVIGGATLSRGLTLEGLISSYFLRSVNQADTLMQMGRWFGYRKGYELIPRIWLSEKTYDQFRFLSELDQDLRDEIQEMEILGKSPSQYGPRVKNSPKLSFIRITAKNRMQSAKPADMDYSGSFTQTQFFVNNESVLKHNIKITESFINQLGSCEITKPCNEKHAGHAKIWRNVKFAHVKEYLKSYMFSDKLIVFKEIDPFIEWIEKMTQKGDIEDWNVIVSGRKNGKEDSGVWRLPFGTVNKVIRTRKNLDYMDSEVINIGALRDPRDIIADVDLENQKESLINEVGMFKSKKAKIIRRMAGLESTPQLIIYMIDKNSDTKSESRRKLDAVADIVGLCVNIPGGKSGTNYAATVSIDLKNNIFDDEGDIEADEN